MTHDRTDPEQAIKAAPTLTRSQVETAQHYVEREDAVNVTLPKYIAAGLCSMALRCSELESRLREVEVGIQKIAATHHARRSGESQDAPLRQGGRVPAVYRPPPSESERCLTFVPAAVDATTKRMDDDPTE